MAATILVEWNLAFFWHCTGTRLLNVCGSSRNNSSAMVLLLPFKPCGRHSTHVKLFKRNESAIKCRSILWKKLFITDLFWRSYANLCLASVLKKHNLIDVSYTVRVSHFWNHTFYRTSLAADFIPCCLPSLWCKAAHDAMLDVEWLSLMMFSFTILVCHSFNLVSQYYLT